MYDLLVRGGSVVDGTGQAPIAADVAVRDGRIVRVGADLDGEAAEVVDATGLIVTPGFVDVHTHFDGQATWDSLLEPSTPHGVTTVVAGNCGVGFAPVRPGAEKWLIELMEGVEDIPGSALHEGISWGWETFGEYLEVLGRRQWAADLGVQVPHGAVRGYVMGERAATRDAATADEIDAMARAVRDGIEAGALGFSTSRTLGHTALDGTPVPGTYAAAAELFAIARAVKAGGGNNFEVAGAGIVETDDPAVVAAEMDWIGRLAADTGLTTTFIVLQEDHAPTRWRDDMARARMWRDRGASVVPLVAGRPFGVLLGWEIRHPFRLRPSYEAVDHLPLPERLEHLARPEVRARILDERPVGTAETVMSQDFVERILPSCFVLGDAPDYEQPPEMTLGALAQAAGTSPEAVAYDAMCAGSMLLLNLFNYTDGNHDALYEQMADPAAVLGLDDAGAHCGAICDASMTTSYLSVWGRDRPDDGIPVEQVVHQITTYLLTHWVRDRRRGPRLALADAVRRLTSQPAELYGFADRGRIAAGLRADLNIIDLEHLGLRAPRAVHDLPAGGLRILQDATGYRATVVAGEVTRRDGMDTGARPGRLLRR
jgi:N-acyl-D-amino-acid deacylase